VVGASGFLGSRLLALAPPGVELAGTGGRRPVRPGNWAELHCDLSAPGQLRQLIDERGPDTVFLCAYDRSNPAVTVDAAVAAARATAALGARLIFFSTDLVFDGETGGYTEDAPTGPLSPYGKMKAEAEALVRAENAGAVVIRTSLLVGSSGPILRPAYECEAMVERKPVTLYNDEWRSPTHVDDLSHAAWQLAAVDVTGVHHLAGPERMSRLELGRILAKMFRFRAEKIVEAERPTERPRDTSLDSSRAVALLGWAPRALSEFVGQPAAAVVSGHG
jgi:dTDP-4-dehydrorhamnose reductase